MRPEIQDLKNPNEYIEIASFPINDTVKYIMDPENYGKTAPVKKIPPIWILPVLVLIGAFFGYFGGLLLKTMDWTGILFDVLIVFIVLLPFHEWIHGMSFKHYGAKEVGYGVSWKALMVYAYSQNFPVNMRELKIIAVMPFAVISFLLLCLMLIFPQYQNHLILIFTIHALLCGGDFALIKYALKNKHKIIYTYDDVIVEKKTYFYEKV